MQDAFVNVSCWHYLRIDIHHTLQRWEESYAPIPNSGDEANWMCQGMACIIFAC